MGKKIWIVDMDGTYALCEHRLHHILDGEADWDAFYAEMDKDVVNEPLAKILRLIIASGDEVAFWTGRPEKYRPQTENWLKHALPYKAPYTLRMRATGDDRSDANVKMDFYNDLMGRKYDVVAVFEDRPSVIRMWRSMDITVFMNVHSQMNEQLANPGF